MIASSSYVVRLRPNVITDSYGDEVVSWAKPIRRRLSRASIKRGTSVDVKDLTAHATATVGTFYAEGLVDVRKDDRLEEADGTVWDVTGAAVRHRGLASSQTLANVKRRDA